MGSANWNENVPSKRKEERMMPPQAGDNQRNRVLSPKTSALEYRKALPRYRYTVFSSGCKWEGMTGEMAGRAEWVGRMTGEEGMVRRRWYSTLTF